MLDKFRMFNEDDPKDQSYTQFPGTKEVLMTDGMGFTIEAVEEEIIADKSQIGAFNQSPVWFIDLVHFV